MSALASDQVQLRFVLTRAAVAVATGVQFGDGTCAMRWLSKHASTVVYSSWDDLARVHHVGEGGSAAWTTASWLDGVCFACGANLHDVHVMFGGNGAQCGRCSAVWYGPPNRVFTPGEGVWVGLEEGGDVAQPKEGS